MEGSEIRHSPLSSKLEYQVETLDRWIALVGGGRHIVRRNDAADWSLLTPLGKLKKASGSMPKGSLVVPLRKSGETFQVFRPCPDSPVSPLMEGARARARVCL